MKGQNICAVISVEAAVPNTTEKQYRPYWNYKPSRHFNWPMLD